MGELFAEIVHEITAEPVKFVVEIVQFLIFVAIIWGVGFRGFRKNKGMITNMLAERREKIRLQLERVREADNELRLAKEKAQPILQQARLEATQIIKEVKQTAEEERAAILAGAGEEISNIKKQTEETLEKERAEALSGIHDQLVDLVTIATRHILEEELSPSEQRALVQKAILASLDDLEGISLS